MITFLASVLIGYVCGSIPTAIWVGKAVGGIDVRRKGSGNAGATNVARLLGTKWGVAVGAIDLLKGFLPVLLFTPAASRDPWIAPQNAGLAIGVAAILGHIFPLFAGFKGGKGVLTALGVFAALLPWEALFAAAVWGGVFWRWRIVSLGSIVAVIAFAALVAVRKFAFGVDHPRSIVVAAFVIAILVLVTHRQNIARLWRGEEKRFEPQQ